jgi:hypothetical protein
MPFLLVLGISGVVKAASGYFSYGGKSARKRQLGAFCAGWYVISEFLSWVTDQFERPGGEVWLGAGLAAQRPGTSQRAAFKTGKGLAITFGRNDSNRSGWLLQTVLFNSRKGD